MTDLAARVREALDRTIRQERTLSGGCIADVRHLTLDDGREMVAKIGDGLDLEGFMLSYLATHSRLPVPEVFHAAPDLLLMAYLPSGDRLSPATEIDAADHLAALHTVNAPSFGFERATVIGGLRQPNPQEASWPTFFRDHRLMYTAAAALKAGKLPADVFSRIEALCARLDRWIDNDARPALIHGDMWTGNVLVHGSRIAGFVDPAIYHADPEIELAFSTLFGTFGKAFFARYQEHRPLRPGFAERKDIYNLYPLLVHVRLFGGSYVNDVNIILRRFGH